MRKNEVVRLVREAGRLARESEFYLIGSQAAHAVISRPPAEVLLSRECDLYPRNRPETAEVLHRLLGPRSDFARRKGFYADVVTPEIATLPAGWDSRLQALRCGTVTAWCLEIHDLVLSKLAAGRIKDLEFAAALIKLGYARRRTLVARLSRLESARDAGRVRSRFQTVLDDIASARRR
jgi:hypothetical protein